MTATKTKLDYDTETRARLFTVDPPSSPTIAFSSSTPVCRSLVWKSPGAMSSVADVYAGQFNRPTPGFFLICLLICLFLLDLQSTVHCPNFFAESIALPY